MTYDIAVIGGGIVGLSFAMQATEKFPRLRVVVLEKEAGVARHQTGHNSGVMHSGVYYKAGSLKARLCVVGAREMVEFCSRHGIPHKVCGKLIVATDSGEAARLDELLARGVANGLDGLRLLGREAMLEIEPHVGGERALYVPSTGITDFAAVAAKYAEIAAGRGAEIKTGAGVGGFDRSSGAKSAGAGDAVVIRTRAGDFTARYVVNCAGLHSDRVARMAGHDPGMMIVPFRGEYYDLAAARWELVAEAVVGGFWLAVGAGCADEGYDAGRVRSAGAGCGSGWRGGGCFRVRGARAVLACPECAFSRRDGIVADWAGDLEDGAAG